MAAIEIVTPPAEEPVTLQEAKDHLRVEVASDDGVIARLIADAREWGERYTRRALVTQTRRVWLNGFPMGPDLSIRLHGGRVASVSSVKYLDVAGVEQTLPATDYQLDAKDPQGPSRLWPAYGLAWPSTRRQPNAVQVQYVAGYGAAAAVPAIVKQALLLHVGWHYEHREAADRDEFLHCLELKLADLRVYEFG